MAASAEAEAVDMLKKVGAEVEVRALGLGEGACELNVKVILRVVAFGTTLSSDSRSVSEPLCSELSSSIEPEMASSESLASR